MIDEARELPAGWLSEQRITSGSDYIQGVEGEKFTATEIVSLCGMALAAISQSVSAELVPSVEDVREFIFRKLVGLGRDDAANTVRYMNLSAIAPAGTFARSLVGLDTPTQADAEMSAEATAHLVTGTASERRKAQRRVSDEWHGAGLRPSRRAYASSDRRIAAQDGFVWRKEWTLPAPNQSTNDQRSQAGQQIRSPDSQESRASGPATNLPDQPKQTER